ncbi:MAG TPA: protein kinase [Gemmatimonadaceae bacterium]|nr:protein kinase [Gemmatimonadaceae bacterium]
MSDPIDSRLGTALAGHYAIERELGVGGMATVYLARDLRHDRHVALKVMRPELAAVIGAQRFLNEIKTTANLQHPHILPLHDSGEVNGTVFYVMPFVEGESLRDRLTREKQLPVEDAVRIAREVADALGYAHQHGVIHRDIKPENILLQGGHALVADFGIALAAAKTGSSRMTETGLSLGTPTYMSPEQAMGEREIDARTDLYALGCVLYEMLAGEPPFAGPTPQAIVAKILTDEPRKLTLLRRSVPPNVDAATRQALEKLPADRFATAADFAAALGTPGFARAGDGRPAARGTTGESGRRWIVPALAGALVGAGLAAGISRAGGVVGGGPARVLHLGLLFPPKELPREGTFGMPTLALAPDGSGFVYAGPGVGTRAQLWLRRWDQPNAIPIPGTEEATYPRFSPDGSSIAFITKPAQLRIVSLTGGVSRVVTDTGMMDQAAFGSGVAWSPDGSTLYATGKMGLLRISPTGKDRRQITTIDTAHGERSHALPDVLPNGKGVLISLVSKERLTIGAGSVAVVDLATGKVQPILKGTHALYVRGGYIVYTQGDGAVMAVPFDQNRLQVTGSAVALGDTVALSSGTAALGDFDVSPQGDLIFFKSGGNVTRVVWVEESGAESDVSPLLTDAYFSTPRLSPDGSRLAVAINRGNGEQLTVLPLAGGPPVRLTFDGAVNEREVWSPDGKRIVWISDRSTRATAFEKRADGGGELAPVTEPDPRQVFGLEWTSAGGWLLMRTDDQSPGNGDIIGVRPGIDSAVRSFVATPAEELAPAVSPNGRWLAYSSDETGRREIFVRPFPETDRGRYQVSTDGGTEPLWSRDGKELYYRAADEHIVAVPIGPGAEFAPGSPRTLFDVSAYLQAPQHRDYDVAADGRFLMVRQKTPAADRIVVTFGFTKEVEARVKK